MYKRPIYQYTWNHNMSALKSTDGILKNMYSHGTKVEPNVIWQLVLKNYISWTKVDTNVIFSWTWATFISKYDWTGNSHENRVLSQQTIEL